MGVSKCLYRYRLKSQSAPAVRDSRPAFEGSVCQKIIDKWYEANKLKDSDYPQKCLPETFEQYFTDPDLCLKSGETRESLYSSCARYLDNYVDMLRDEHLLNLDGVKVEFWYGTAENPLPMTMLWDFAGASDFFKEGTDGDEIYDGKCSVRAGSANYMQLFMYAAAHERLFSRKVKSVHFLYYRQKVKRTFPFNEEIKSKVMRRMDQVCRQIQRGDLPPKPSEKNCRFCPYRKACEFSQVKA